MLEVMSADLPGSEGFPPAPARAQPQCLVPEPQEDSEEAQALSPSSYPRGSDASSIYEGEDENMLVLYHTVDSKTAVRGEVRVDLNAARTAASQALTDLLCVKPIKAASSTQSSVLARASKPTISRRSSGPAGSNHGHHHPDDTSDVTHSLRSCSSRGIAGRSGMVADHGQHPWHGGRPQPPPPPPPPPPRSTRSGDSAAGGRGALHSCVQNVVLSSGDISPLSPFSVFHQLSNQQSPVMQRTRDPQHTYQHAQQPMADSAALTRSQMVQLVSGGSDVHRRMTWNGSSLLHDTGMQGEMPLSTAANLNSAMPYAAQLMDTSPPSLHLVHRPGLMHRSSLGHTGAISAQSSAQLSNQPLQPLQAPSFLQPAQASSLQDYLVLLQQPQTQLAAEVYSQPWPVEQADLTQQEDLLNLAQLLQLTPGTAAPPAPSMPVYDTAAADALVGQLGVLDIGSVMDLPQHPGVNVQLQQLQRQLAQSAGQVDLGGVFMPVVQQPPGPASCPEAAVAGQSATTAAASRGASAMPVPTSILQLSQRLQQQQQALMQQQQTAMQQVSSSTAEDSNDAGSSSSADGPSPWLTAFQLASTQTATTATKGAFDSGAATLQQLLAEHQMLLSLLGLLLRWSAGGVTGQALADELLLMSTTVRAHKMSYPDGFSSGAQLGFHLAAATMTGRVGNPGTPPGLQRAVRVLRTELVTQGDTTATQLPPALSSADLVSLFKLTNRHLNYLTSLMHRQTNKTSPGGAVPDNVPGGLGSPPLLMHRHSRTSGISHRPSLAAHQEENETDSSLDPQAGREGQGASSNLLQHHDLQPLRQRLSTPGASSQAMHAHAPVPAFAVADMLQPRPDTNFDSSAVANMSPAAASHRRGPSWDSPTGGPTPRSQSSPGHPSTAATTPYDAQVASKLQALTPLAHPITLDTTSLSGQAAASKNTGVFAPADIGPPGSADSTVSAGGAARSNDPPQLLQSAGAGLSSGMPLWYPTAAPPTSVTQVWNSNANAQVTNSLLPAATQLQPAPAHTQPQRPSTAILNMPALNQHTPYMGSQVSSIWSHQQPSAAATTLGQRMGVSAAGGMQIRSSPAHLVSAIHAAPGQVVQLPPQMQPGVFDRVLHSS